MKRKLANPPEDDEHAKRNTVSPMLHRKVNAFLNDDNVDPKGLQAIVDELAKPDVLKTDEIHVISVLYANLVKRNLIYGFEEEAVKAKAKSKANQKSTNKNLDNKWLTHYNEAWSKLLSYLGSTSKNESSRVLNVCLHLISIEKSVRVNYTPNDRLRSILEAIINSNTTPPAAIEEFEKCARSLDILQLTFELLKESAPVSFVDSPNAALNYLSIVNALDMSKKVINDQKYWFKKSKKSQECSDFDYEQTRQNLNTVWIDIIGKCSGLDEKVHRQVLVVLLERIMPHLEDPILLTDFLMDSLHQFDGPIALLALQGIFTLMQKQNITYPDVYQKLYNMFYPKMFYNKYKARLFYLADIFLTSTHLPENLVAAFVKRLARLALKSPTDDAIIMIRFICNLLLRHTGLQRLIYATAAASAEDISDSYDEQELDPVKAGALNSSLWEMSLLQKHAVPEISSAAHFVSKSLPIMEFDLAPLLEMKECDIFDDEVKKQMKQFAMGYERPTNVALPQNDIVTKYWDII